MKLVRSYKLRIYPNFHKLEEIRYNASTYKKYLQHFVTQLYFSQKRFLSTVGMGTLANQAQKEAVGILKAHRESVKALEIKSNVPQITRILTPARIEFSNKTSFDYWISISSQWSGLIKVPAKGTKPLNKALKNSWKISTGCKVCQGKSGDWYCIVFVKKEVEKSIRKNEFLGIDVGIKHSVTRSDGYLGKNLTEVITKENKKQYSRNKNKTKNKSTLFSNKKSAIKQILDKEVNQAVRRSKKLDYSISVENPKALANLTYLGKMSRWAKSYFANRMQTKASEEGVWVSLINPSYTSITCSTCRTIDKKSRVSQSLFQCVACGNTVHADLNAARNISLKGKERAKAQYNPLNL